jgi:ubiquinone/menaquinone biosynthesis C-methylase UbiE
MKLKARGIHDLIINLIKKDLVGKKILDIGCGLGRMSILASKHAESVTGIDHTQNAINIANILKHATNSKNIEFICTSIEEYKPKEKFDIIIISGTLEHIIECEQMIAKIVKLLTKNGIIISDSPSEFNPRGILHASLWKLFDFPMTLSDVNIITPFYMGKIAKENKLIVYKKIGTLYYRGWGEAGLVDLKQRLPNVFRDIKDKISKLKINYSEYNLWIEESFQLFDKLLKEWTKSKFIKKIPKRQVKINFDLNYLLLNQLNQELIMEYMSPDYSIDPYYSDREPYINYSGNIIYFMKRI